MEHSSAPVGQRRPTEHPEGLVSQPPHRLRDLDDLHVPAVECPKLAGQYLEMAKAAGEQIADPENKRIFMSDLGPGL